MKTNNKKYTFFHYEVIILTIFIFIEVLILTTCILFNDSIHKIEVEPITISSFTYELEETKQDIVGIEKTVNPVDKAIEKMQLEMNEIKAIEDKKEWFLAYKDIVYRYSKWIDTPETVFDYFTEEEMDLILRAVETECYDQDFISKANVASVIFNRIELGGEFGDNVTEIITTPKQFAHGITSITQDTILATMYAWEIEDTTDGCVAFRSDKNAPDKWRKWNKIFKDDAGHYFYK